MFRKGVVSGCAIAALLASLCEGFAPVANVIAPSIVVPGVVVTRDASPDPNQRRRRGDHRHRGRVTTSLSLSSSSSSSSEREGAGRSPWHEDDRVVTIVPKFKVKEGMMEPYSALLPKFIELVKANEGGTCVHYGFVGPTEDGFVICREGYVSADAVLRHLENVGSVLKEALQYADIVDLMVQGPQDELEKLKGPLADFGPSYYPLFTGSLRSRRVW